MKVQPIAINHIEIELEEGSILELNDGGVSGLYIGIPIQAKDRESKLIVFDLSKRSMKIKVAK